MQDCVSGGQIVRYFYVDLVKSREARRAAGVEHSGRPAGYRHYGDCDRKIQRSDPAGSTQTRSEDSDELSGVCRG